MTKPLRLVVLKRSSVYVAYFDSPCRGTFRDCPQKGTNVDLILLALQISGLEYVDPFVANTAHSIGQMLQNGTADLDLGTSAITYDDYEWVAFTGAVDKECYYFMMPLQEPIVYTEFLLDTFPWIYYVYLALGIAAISTILTISQRESVRSMLVEWPLRLLAVVLRQPALDHFAKHARLSGLVAAAASLLPFTIFAMYFELNIKLLLALIHVMKHDGYEFVMIKDGVSPMDYATPKQTAELEALDDRYQSRSASWSVNHCVDFLIDGDNSLYLGVKIKGITPQFTVYAMRRELYKERERLNRALALIQPAAINFLLKYGGFDPEYSLKLNPKYNTTVRFAQYRMVLVFFGAIYLSCVLVFFLEIIVHKMVRWLRVWRKMGTARLFH